MISGEWLFHTQRLHRILFPFLTDPDSFQRAILPTRCVLRRSVNSGTGHPFTEAEGAKSFELGQWGPVSSPKVGQLDSVCCGLESWMSGTWAGEMDFTHLCGASPAGLICSGDISVIHVSCPFQIYDFLLPREHFSISSLSSCGSIIYNLQDVATT